ncbi:hypothetical protein ACHHYP_04763 [Achlya hypogyna]|uniref:DUF1764-domain-containing protein n=1 Tax=Achlya hypogyna TaxID=1202772 RepID=A0A1V9Z0A7_ACHHY|nr:hypothetical protein ACHHYP_04763 [Achlya hypogyna]
MAPLAPPATKSKLVQKVKPNKPKRTATKIEAKPVPAAVEVTAPNPAKKAKKKKKKEAAPAENDQAVEAADEPEEKAVAKEELDALFSVLKAKKKQKKADTAAEQKRLDDERAEKMAYRKKLEKLESEYKAKNSDTSNPVPVRYDADGLPIYTAASLRINQGGDTADCPFDCWCCF